MFKLVLFCEFFTVTDSIHEVFLDSHSFGKTDSFSDAVGIQIYVTDAVTDFSLNLF